MNYTAEEVDRLQTLMNGISAHWEVKGYSCLSDYFWFAFEELSSSLRETSRTNNQRISQERINFALKRIRRMERGLNATTTLLKYMLEVGLRNMVCISFLANI